ncbi:DUF2231 domain-containing protein [Georgenia thermotolerans]|uniref:Rieske 2Fe-2S domain-containing protein n=1 Tax=Georgenia thermotolerans TaxID=527326 RepID=A0A7J5US86_9MICO|nr:DUF2231 domain-containing protein [Georgenia thermotolerans]KAE8765147.1 Rieske 2Fe-2S domain-containing protein [Georgenia thermotolerans]
MQLARLVGKLEQEESLDPAVDALVGAVNQVLPPGEIKDILHGKFLGHALHPLLVTLPIGMNVGALLLDLTGGKSSRRAAQRLVGAAVLLVGPTAAAGLADWSELGSDNRPKRVGLVHAGANVVATGFFAASWLARRRGRHGTGAALALAGSAGLSVGGYLGGHLAYSEAVAVNRNADRTPTPEDWEDVAAAGDLGDGMLRAEAAGQPVLLGRHGGALFAMGAVCSHLGGALDEGEVVDDEGGCVVCPLHGSHFRLSDASVARGPATAPVLAYDVRQVGDRIQVRARA